MLQAIRDRAQSWLAWVIVGFITIPFALWGIQSYLQVGGPQLIAEVEGIEIQEKDFRNTVDNFRQQQRARLAQIFGNDLNNPLVKSLLDDKRIKQQALDGMIDSRLMTLAAAKAGFHIGEKQIDAMILGEAGFRKNGKFDDEAYQRYIRSQGMSSEGFKARIAQEQVTNQLVNGLAITAFATPYEVDEQLRIMFQQREAAYLTLKAASYEHEAKLDDARIKAYYDENIEQFKTEQKVSIEYLELNAATVAKSITVDEDALRNFYEQRKDDYLVQADAEQRKLLMDIAARVNKGESFAALAKEYSQDVGSAENGGDIGFIGRAVMDKSFEDAMFALKAGEVSGVVTSSLGLHLIKLEEIKGEERHVRHILLNLDKQKLRSRSFDEVRAQIESDFKRSRAEKLFNDKYDQLNNLSFEHPGTLSIAAEELGMKLQQTEAFGRAGGAGIAAIPAVFNAAYSDNVLEQGRNSELLDLGGERIVVLRIKENMPAAPRPLEEVNEQIITLLLKEVGAERARKVGNEVLGKLREGANPQSLAREHNAEWQATKAYSRDSKGIVPSVLNNIFSMPRPVGDKATFATSSLPNGDFTVIGLYSVKDGESGTREAAERLAAAKRISSADAGSAVGLLRKDLRAKAKVTIYEKNL